MFTDDDTPAAAYTRGLTIVHALADRRGFNRYPHHALWWAEIDWTEPDGTGH